MDKAEELDKSQGEKYLRAFLRRRSTARLQLFVWPIFHASMVGNYRGSLETIGRLDMYTLPTQGRSRESFDCRRD